MTPDATRSTASLSIAVVSSGGPFDLGAALARGFRLEGHDATVVPEPLPRVRWLARAALEGGARVPDHVFTTATTLDRLERHAWDLVVVVKGAFVSPSTIRRIRHSAPVVCWNADSPFDHALSNRGGMIHAALGEYDAYVTWSMSLAASLRDRRDCVIRIPFGIDPALERDSVPPVPTAGRIVLVGTATAERIRLIERLARRRPVVFGNGWSGVGCEVHPPVFGGAYMAVVADAAWCLNPLRPQNRDSHNMRSFELVAAGAAQLTYDTADHVELLGGTRVRLGASVDELASIVDTTDPPPSSDDDVSAHHYRVRCRQLLDELVHAAVLDATPQAE